MFYQNRFTERARQALTLAQERPLRSATATSARSTCCSGLLREGGGPAAKALTAAGVTDEALVKQIEELSGRGTRIPPRAGHDAAHQAHRRAVCTVRE